MNSKIQKIDYFISNYLNKTEEQIMRKFGKPEKISDHEMWFYSKYNYVIFKEEIIFFMNNKKVVDIAITEYILGKAIRNIFYFKGENPDYKIFELH